MVLSSLFFFLFIAHYIYFFLQACTFLARSDLKKPTSRLAYTIGDSMKPKARENITAEMKLRCFSLTVLDSLCGMVCFFLKLEQLGSDDKIVPLF